jgi:glutaredoxin
VRDFRRVSGLLLIVLAAASLGSTGCRTKRSSGATIAPANADVPPAPTIAVRDDSTGLTFSYITVDGGFQLAKKVAEVPYEARDVVRVWSEVSGDGIVGPWVYVVDLRQKLGDGSYKVDVMKREAFDEIAAKRRAKGAPLGPVGQGTGAAPTASGEPPTAAHGKLTAIIYGASWCKPCHQVEDYLKRKGVPFVHRDIEEDDGAQQEMRAKLKKAGLRAGSIPVIDLGGKILIGFSADEIDQAIADAH